MKFGVTYTKKPVVQKEKGLTKHVKRGVAVPAKSELNVVFPKWEVGVKRKKRSRWAASKRCKAVESPSVVSGALSVPVEGCPIEDSMDDELLACVFMRLNMKDLSASMRTCKRWHRIACKEDVWEHIPLPANVPGALPRSIRTLAWLCTTFGGMIS